MIEICYSQQLQQLQDVPSHQADHGGPITEETLDQYVCFDQGNWESKL